MVLEELDRKCKNCEHANFLITGYHWMCGVSRKWLHKYSPEADTGCDSFEPRKSLETCLERFRREYPDCEKIDPIGTACPDEYGYASSPSWCGTGIPGNCQECWDRYVECKEGCL